MAKKSEELIEKPVASRGRPSLKVSKKSTSETKEVKNETTITKTSTSKKANKKISKPTSQKTKKENLAEIKDVEKIETVTETIVENVEPVKKAKRTIKNISAKKTSSTKNSTKINTKTVSKRKISSSKRGVILTPVSENGPEIIVAPKNNKRTLKLNLETTKKTANSELSKTTSYEEKINQNSVFFNSPSIFTKFNIDITSADPEETVDIQPELSEALEIESDSKLENVQDSQINDESEVVLEEKDIIETVVEILESNIPETEISNSATETINNESSNSNPETVNQENESLDFNIEIEDLENGLLDLNSVNEIQPDNLVSEIESQENDDTIVDESDSETNTELVQETEITESSAEIDSALLEELLEENCIDELIESDINIVDTETTSESDTLSEVIEIASEPEKIEEAADTVIDEPNTHKTNSDNPIGKFFDSSIPSMTSTVNNTFTKIKKSIFNFSPIFKKFTFEEASLANNVNNEQIEETFSSQPENNLTDIQKALENFVPNANNISEMEIQAEPSTLSIPVIETETPASPITSDFAPAELVETNINDYTNVITPASDSSYSSEEYDEIEEYNFSNKLVDKLILEAESLNENENTTENSDITETNIDYNDISLEDVEKLKQDDYNDETFSIESYFGIADIDNDTDCNNESTKTDINSSFTESSENSEPTSLSSEEFINKFLETNAETQHNDSEIVTESVEKINNDNNSTSSSENDEFEKTLKEKDLEISTLSKLLEQYSETISSLSDRIASLENKKQEESTVESEDENNNIVDNDIDQELDLDSIQIEDLDIDLNDLLDDNEQSEEEPSLIPTVEDESSSDVDSNDSELVESLLSEAFLSKDLDSSLKDELLSEVLSFEENTENNDLDNELLESALLESLSNDELSAIENTVAVDKIETEAPETSTSTNISDNSDDFFKIIDSLTKAITELEQIPDIKQEATPPSTVDELPNELISTVTEEKAINILINKDDIFSISILNETYEIVSDFDGTSVLSENIHISTPKNNFYVKVGNKYIEIHNKKDHFVLNTNFEDIEFANAINNIAFAKKNNKIELNIKEAFKLSSINNKIELSMLNKAIADLSNTTSTTTTTTEENSICDNKTLLISEETQKVYLPYTIEDVMKKLRTSDEYQTVQEVIDNEYTLPLSTFKMPIISRFKEAYRFMRVKEKSSVYAAVDLAVELMFNSNLNPAVIRAAKDLKELNIYLDCLYENEIEKFDCFKIVYKVLPKIK